MVEHSMSEYARRVNSTLYQFKRQHQKVLSDERAKSHKRDQVRHQYLSKIKEIEGATKWQKRRIKKLEIIEQNALDKLKNTTIMHDYVRSRFEEAFWPGLNISANIGSQSYRSSNKLFNVDHDNTVENQEYAYETILDQSLKSNIKDLNKTELNLFFSPKQRDLTRQYQTSKAPFYKPHK